MTPTQIKIALYAGAALLAWLLTKRAAKDITRVSRELDIDANVLSPTFGMRWDEINSARVVGPAGGVDNPAENEQMRQLIDRSNAVIAEDDRLTGVE